VLGLLWTLAIIHYSARQGRLAHEADYDDCMFMFDGYWRLQVLDRAGLYPALKTFVNAFPHAPWSSIQSFTAFQIFGVHDYAPYFLNIIPVLLLFLIIARIGHGCSNIDRILLLLLGLSFQTAFVMVYEFRPDPLYAVVVVLAVTLLFVGHKAESRLPGLRDQIAVFALLGLSMYIKPTFFANTFIFAGALWGVLYWQALRHPTTADDGIFSITNLLGAIWRCMPALLTFTLMILPLLLIRFDYFYDYLVRNAYGSEKDIWRNKDGAWGSFRHFTIGWGGMSMIGKSLWTGLALTAGGMALTAIRGRWYEFRSILWMLGFTGLGLMVMMIGQLNGPYFGLTFHFMLVATAITALVLGAGGFTRAPLRWLLPLFTVLAILVNIHVWQTFMPQPRDGENRPVHSVAHKTHGIAHSVMDGLADELGAMGRKDVKLRVFVAFTGRINAGTLRWMAAKRRLLIDFDNFDRNEPIEDYVRQLDTAEFVLTAAAGAPEMNDYLPTSRHHGAVHEIVAADPRFREVAAYPTYAPGGYHLYRRVSE
jgi:hypothetical protein